jgi:hypothetical protein
MLWEEQKTETIEYNLDDTALMKELALEANGQACKALSHYQQAALMNFVTQLQALDRGSRELLQILRILAGLDSDSSLHASQRVTDPFQSSAWNPERLLKALFPATCWIVGYAFWFYVNPPGGTAIPMMCAIFGLMMTMAPANLFGLLIVLLLSMFIFVAPVYMLLMPTLDSGFGLLALIFGYTFVFAYLGGRSPVLKIGPLVMFIMMININNDQVYSFIALVTTGLVLMLGISIVVLVHQLLSPMHAEKVLLRSVQRFLAGSARIVGDFRQRSPRQQVRGRRRRKRVFETAILPISAQLLSVEKNLDYPQFPDNTPEKVQDLVDNLQSIRFRLQGLETSYDTAERESPELMQTLAPLNKKWRLQVQGIFERWARLERADTLLEEWITRTDLSHELEQQLAELERGKRPDDIDNHALQNLYAVMGSIQSLLDAMKELGDSMKQINWNQWAVARF